MSEYQRNIFVENVVELTGNKDYVDEALAALKDDKGKVDFSRIIPIYKDKKDLPMDRKMNDALNVWLDKHKDEIDKDEYIRAIKFTGRTREKAYEFKELSNDELNAIKSSNKVDELLNKAEDFINKIKEKILFNGFFARVGAWGTCSQPIDQKVNGCRITFYSVNTPALKVFEKLSTMFPNIKVVYTYKYKFECKGKKDKYECNRVTYKNGKEDIVEQKTNTIVSDHNLIRQFVTIGK